MTLGFGFAFQGVASKLCFRDKSQLKLRFCGRGVCSERFEIIPNVWCGANFVEAHIYDVVTFRGRRSILCALDPRGVFVKQNVSQMIKRQEKFLTNGLRPSKLTNVCMQKPMVFCFPTI